MKNIYIKNFDILNQTMVAVLKLVPSFKLIFNNTGMTIHCAKSFARCSVFTNSVYSDEEFSLCINDGAIFLKTLEVLKSEEGKKPIVSSNIEMKYDDTFIYIKTKGIKTKIITVKEEVIQNHISKAVTSQLTPVLEFKTSSDIIKKVLNNSYMFSDPENARIYLNQQEEMLQNCIYAEITNKNNRLSNNITTKLGDITVGKISEDIIIDFERLGVFTIFKSDNIEIKLMDKPFLVADLAINNADIFSKFTIYCSIRKS